MPCATPSQRSTWRRSAPAAGTRASRPSRSSSSTRYSRPTRSSPSSTSSQREPERATAFRSTTNSGSRSYGSSRQAVSSTVLPGRSYRARTNCGCRTETRGLSTPIRRTPRLSSGSNSWPSSTGGSSPGITPRSRPSRRSGSTRFPHSVEPLPTARRTASSRRSCSCRTTFRARRAAGTPTSNDSSRSAPTLPCCEPQSKTRRRSPLPRLEFTTRSLTRCR